jgi:hypothetical protein
MVPPVGDDGAASDADCGCAKLVDGCEPTKYGWPGLAGTADSDPDDPAGEAGRGENPNVNTIAPAAPIIRDLRAGRAHAIEHASPSTTALEETDALTSGALS